MWLALLAGCAPAPQDTDPPALAWDYPLDDLLRLDHLQAIGTHNSYHVQTTPLDAWAYTHPPLDVQLEAQGVRQLELDLYWDDVRSVYEVLHIPFLDPGSNCPLLTDCLEAMKGWSDTQPGHHPVAVLLELKDAHDPATAAARLDALDMAILSIWPEDRLVTPALVRGTAPDVRTALADTGWPTLGALRQRALFVLHAGGPWRDSYLTDGADRPLFPDAYGDLDLPFAAFHSLNDAHDPRIPDVVAAGHLVRTRADADTREARLGDTTRRDAALASGAHFVSTDFPAPVDWTDYVVTLPDGAPSRCNPRSAPDGCTPEDVERAP